MADALRTEDRGDFNIHMEPKIFSMLFSFKNSWCWKPSEPLVGSKNLFSPWNIDTACYQVCLLLCCFWNFRLRNAVSPANCRRLFSVARYRIEFFIWLKLRFCKDASKFLKNHHFKFVPCSPVKSTVEILQIFLENMNSNTSNLPQIY